MTGEWRGEVLGKDDARRSSGVPIEWVPFHCTHPARLLGRENVGIELQLDPKRQRPGRE